MLHQVKSFPGSVCSFGSAWAEAELSRILEEMYSIHRPQSSLLGILVMEGR